MLAQGRDNVREYLEQNPEVMDKLEQEIRANAHKLMTPQARKGREQLQAAAVDIRRDDFEG